LVLNADTETLELDGSAIITDVFCKR